MYVDIENITLFIFFIMLVLVVYKPAKSAFNLETFPSLVISGCISALCIIGMKSIFGDSFKMILLPYVAMGISILFIMLITFICKLFKNDNDDKIFNNNQHINNQNKIESGKIKRDYD